METLKKLLGFLNPLPAWLRVVIAALVTAVVSICVLLTACTMASSCGITQSVVNNIDSDGNTIEMGVTPSTTTSTTASPEIPINAPLKNSMWLVFVALTLSPYKIDRYRLCVDAHDESLARSKVEDFMSTFFFLQPFQSFTIEQVSQPPELYFIY